MENIIEYSLGGILTIIPVLMWIVKQVATNLVTDFVKTTFKLKSDSKAATIYNMIMIVLIILGISIILITSVVISGKDSEVIKQEQHIPKTDTELIVDGAVKIAEEVFKGVEKKRKRDAEIIKNRNKRYVYQIGDVKNNEKSVVRLYKKLKESSVIDISNVFVFEPERNKYFLFVNTISSKEELLESLASMKSKLSIIEPVIQVVDLMSFCNAKEDVTESKYFKHRKYKIPKFECDK